MFKFNEMLFMKMIQNLYFQVAEFGNPLTKHTNRQSYFIMCFEVF